MQLQYGPEIRLDSSGNPDLEFYMREARRERAKAFAVVFKGIAGWLRKRPKADHGMPFRTAH